IRHDLVTGVQTCALPIFTELFRAGADQSTVSALTNATPCGVFIQDRFEQRDCVGRPDPFVLLRHGSPPPSTKPISTSQFWRSIQIGRASCRECVEILVVA